MFILMQTVMRLQNADNKKNANKSCASMTVLNRQLNENKGLEKMYNIELQTRKFIAGKGKPTKPGGGGGGGGDTDVDVAPIDDNPYGCY